MTDEIKKRPHTAAPTSDAHAEDPPTGDTETLKASVIDRLIEQMDFSDLIWESDDPYQPEIEVEESEDATPMPQLLKNARSAASNLLSKDVTETGSFDLRWITLVSFGKLLHAVPMPILLLTASGEIQLANSAFLRLAPDPARARYASFYEFFPNNHDTVERMLTEALTLRKPQATEGIIDILGRKVWTRMTLRPIRFGGERSLLAVVEDLTVEKRELELNAKYKLLVNLFPIGIVEFTPEKPVFRDSPPEDACEAVMDARVTGGNVRFSELIGRVKVEEILGASLLDLIGDSQEDVAHFRNWVIGGYSMNPVELKETWAGDDVRYFEYTVVASFQERRLTNFWVMKQDVTERKRVLDELQEKLRTIDELYEHLSQSGQAKAISRHTANVAHELRQPLAIIGGFAKRMARECSEPGEQNHRKSEFDIIINEIRRLEKILNGLIDFTHRECLTLEYACPNSIITDVIKVYQDRLDEKNLVCIMDLSEEATSLMLDSDRFQKVIRCLVANAVEASHPGGVIKVHTRVSVPSKKAQKTGELDSDAYFEIKVENHGRIIPEEDLERIFNPFFTTKSYGTGLGLTLAKKIIEDHGGSISVKSDAQGTFFTIWLPFTTTQG